MPRRQGEPRRTSRFDWRSSSSPIVYLNPTNPRTRLWLGAMLSWFPFLGPAIVLVCEFYFGCATEKRYKIVGWILGGVYSMLSVTAGFLLGFEFTSDPMKVKFTEGGFSVKLRVAGFFVFYILTSLISVGITAAMYRGRDRHLFPNPGQGRSNGNQGTELRPLPPDDGTYARNRAQRETRDPDRTGLLSSTEPVAGGPSRRASGRASRPSSLVPSITIPEAVAHPSQVHSDSPLSGETSSSVSSPRDARRRSGWPV